MCVFVWMSAEWLAHENAVFDIAWVPGNSHMVGTLVLATLIKCMHAGIAFQSSISPPGDCRR